MRSYCRQIENIKDYVIEEDIDKAKEGEQSKEKRLRLYRNILKMQPADKVIEMMKKYQIRMSICFL